MLLDLHFSRQELLGRLPASNRLFLVRQLERIATVDFVSELPEEVSLAILQYLDPPSLVQASQVRMSNFTCLVGTTL